MIAKNFKMTLLLIGVLGLFACGEQPDDAKQDDTTRPQWGESAGESTPELGKAYNLTFAFIVQTESENNSSLNFLIPFPARYHLPVYVKSNGAVTIRAREFPRLVFRVCHPDSNNPNCQTHSELVPTDIDLVLDACGMTRPDSLCGNDGSELDPTLAIGVLDDNGSLTLYQMPFRLRSFFVTEEEDGFTAEDTDTGFIPGERVETLLTTGRAQSGPLIETGSQLNNGIIKLVAAGEFHSNNTLLQNSYFIFTIFGQLDEY